MASRPARHASAAFLRSLRPEPRRPEQDRADERRPDVVLLDAHRQPKGDIGGQEVCRRFGAFPRSTRRTEIGSRASWRKTPGDVRARTVTGYVVDDHTWSSAGPRPHPGPHRRAVEPRQARDDPEQGDRRLTSEMARPATRAALTGKTPRATSGQLSKRRQANNTAAPGSGTRRFGPRVGAVELRRPVDELPRDDARERRFKVHGVRCGRRRWPGRRRHAPPPSPSRSPRSRSPANGAGVVPAGGRFRSVSCPGSGSSSSRSRATTLRSSRVVVSAVLSRPAAHVRGSSRLMIFAAPRLGQVRR